jgi:enolase-phosphatase E1
MESLRDRPVRSILLDIEGTTTPIDFVYQVLFPYARQHVGDFLMRHAESDDVRADIAGLCQEHADDVAKGLEPPALSAGSPEARLQSMVTYIHWLIDQDRKTTPLKSLQGKIWEHGYRTGQLRRLVFPDVPAAFQRWARQKIEICIFSSGSVLAQKLLFAHTTDGDLTPFIRAYFDTTTGPKREPESYRRIAAMLERPPSDIVFVSDVTAELDAAQSAGMSTRLAVRPGNHVQPPSLHVSIETFNDFFS